MARPGRYPLDDTSSQLSDVIAAAGGITAAGADTVVVIRDGKETRLPAIGKSFELKGGETINVERAPVFYIHGEVARSGAHRVEPNMTVMQAIAMGGGITPRGTDRGIKISRRDGTGVQKMDANLTTTVQADDVIYVRESLF